MLTDTAKSLILTFWLLAVITCAIVLADQISEVIEQNKAEGRCIAAFIQLGIERKDIETNGGGCYVK